MTINTNISYEALKGLMGRANTQERLEIADEWLRANEVVSIPEYQDCRRVWNRMYQRYGKFRIIISCGSVKHEYASGLSYGEAYRVCASSRWRHNHNNGCVWDMEIEEDF